MHKDYILLAESAFKRVPSRMLRMMLKESKVKTGRSLDDLKDSIIALINSDKSIDKEKLNNLYSAYLNFTLFGDKTVSISTVNSDALNAIEAQKDKIEPEILAMDINYPFVDEKTDNKLSRVPKLISVEEHQAGMLMTFASVKALEETIELDETYFQQLNANFTLPPELYDVKAKRHVLRRYYDSVFLSFADSSIEFRLDTASLTTKQAVLESLALLQDSFQKTVEAIVDSKALNLNQENLFLAIPGGYEHSPLRVCELGFVVGSVIHQERMRVGVRDLRHELFHQGGKLSLKESKAKLEIKPFRIALRKRRKSVIEGSFYETEAYLPGSAKMLQSKGLPNLEYVIVSNCKNEVDYTDHIISIKNDIDTYRSNILK